MRKNISPLFINFLIVLGFLFPAMAFGTNTITIVNANVDPGNSCTIEIVVNNTEAFTSFQTDIPIPAQLVYNPGSAQFNISRISGHSLSVSIVGNSLRLIAYSFSNTPFIGNTGTLITFELTAGSTPGNYPLILENSLLGNSASQNILTSTVNGTVTINGSTVPENISITNTTYRNGEQVCIGSTGTITVSPDALPVVLENGSIVQFVAGSSIRFLPGFKAESGSYMHASIASDGICSDGKSANIAVSDTEVESMGTENASMLVNSILDGYDVKIYPNPTNGIFQIDMNNFEGESTLMIFNAMGETMYRSIIREEKSPVFDVTNFEKGMYILIISNQKQIISRKILIE